MLWRASSAISTPNWSSEMAQTEARCGRRTRIRSFERLEEPRQRILAGAPIAASSRMARSWARAPGVELAREHLDRVTRVDLEGGAKLQPPVRSAIRSSCAYCSARVSEVGSGALREPRRTKNATDRRGRQRPQRSSGPTPSTGQEWNRFRLIVLICLAALEDHLAAASPTTPCARFSPTSALAYSTPARLLVGAASMKVCWNCRTSKVVVRSAAKRFSSASSWPRASGGLIGRGHGLGGSSRPAARRTSARAVISASSRATWLPRSRSLAARSKVARRFCIGTL